MGLAEHAVLAQVNQVKQPNSAIGLCTSLKYPQYVGPITEFQFRYNKRIDEDIFGAAIEGC